MRGGNPILFPFNGRCFDRGDIFHWRAPDGVRRPMPLHGIARQGDFKVTRLDARGFDAVLVPGDEARACYPYDYEFVVAYRFEPLGLSCEFSLTNLGAEPLPWSAGHHFYFTLPWHPGLARRDYVVKIPSKKQWRHAADGKLVPFAELKGQASIGFDNPHLSDCIFTNLTSATLAFGPKSGEEDITVKVGEEAIPGAWASVVTWTPDPEAPYYCVEPWMGPPNSPEHKNGLRFAEPGQVDTFVTEVSLM